MPDFELSDHESVILKHVRRAPALARHPCISAIEHLRRAWALREIDREMALFRCITAEEEATAAIFHALKRRRYEGAKRLKWRDHRQKAVVAPFLQAVGEVTRDVQGFSAAIVYDKVGDEDRQIRVRVLSTNADGQAIAVYPIPPLDFTVSVNGRDPDVMAEMLKLAGGEGLSRLQHLIRERANERNQLLYAGEKGLRVYTGSIEPHFARYRQNVFSLMTMFVLIDEHPSIQRVVQQCLTAFLAALDAIYPRAAKSDERVD